MNERGLLLEIGGQQFTVPMAATTEVAGVADADVVLFCVKSGDTEAVGRAMLPHLPRSLGPLRVADLGCGNRVLGIVFALANPAAELTLVDESYMAVQSATQNWRAALGQRPVTIRADDGLAGQPADSLDLVLCNPPFHQQQVVGDLLAWRMFTQAKAALVRGGEL